MPNSGCWVRRDAADFAYSDGQDVEQRLIEILKGASDLGSASSELRQRITDWPSLYHLSPQRSNLLRPLSKLLSGKLLEVGAGFGAVSRYMGELGGQVVALEGSRVRATGARLRCRDLLNVTVVVDLLQDYQTAEKFDVVTLIGVLEYARLHFPSGSGDPVDAMLRQARKFLRPGGVLILAIENQLGLKYFAGFHEDHSDLPMFGVSDLYRSDSPVTFGRAELSRRLNQAGLQHQDWLFPFPDYKLPSTVFTSRIVESGADLAPLLESSVLADPQFTRDQAFSLELAWGVIFRNGLVPDLANSFLIVASDDKDAAHPISAGVVGQHYSLSRRPEFASETTFIRRAGDQPLSVHKTRLFPEAVGSDDSPLSMHLQDEAFIPGRNWQSELRRVVNRPDWTFQQLQAWAATWHAALLRHADISSAPASPKPGSLISGDLIDAIPRNLIVDTEGAGRFFDQEWRLKFEIEFGYLLFRALFLELRDMTTVAEPASDVPLDILPLFKRLAQSLGCWISETDFARYVDFENDVQQWATGVKGDLSAADLSQRFLPIRPPLFEHSLAERLQTLAVEIHRLHEETADREAALTEFRARSPTPTAPGRRLPPSSCLSAGWWKI